LYTATLLPGGKVLAAGGLHYDGGYIYLASAELYDSGTVAATTVSGRGSINGQGDRASFNVRARQTNDRPGGSLSFSDPAADVSITKAKIRTLAFTGNRADLSGNTRLSDGTKVTYSLSVTDNGSDGSSDTFTISLSNGYSAGGTLTSGNIQIQ
jgi:expansin (peptidoglycan-binding protein)